MNTDLARKGGGPHHWLYKPGFYAVNEHFQRVDGPTNSNMTTDKIVAHHYVRKSLEAHQPPQLQCMNPCTKSDSCRMEVHALQIVG